MDVKNTWAALAVFAAAGLSGCAGRPATETTTAPATATTRRDAPAETLIERTLDAREPITIELRGQAGTGYAWELRSDPGPVLALTERGVVSNPGEASARVGGSEITRWQFAPRQAGTVELQFVYRRPWEKDVPPVNTARYRIVIR